MDEIISIANKHNLRIIEDCAQAMELSTKEKSWKFWRYFYFQLLPWKNLELMEMLVAL